MSAITRATALMLLTAAAATATATETLSPGSTTDTATIENACPTFSWTQSVEATGYELVVYEIGEDGSPELEPELARSLPGGASSWTPDRCLRRGATFAWSVLAKGTIGAADWTAPRRFRVANRTSAMAVEEAVAVLRTYLQTQARSAATAPAAGAGTPGQPIAPDAAVPVNRDPVNRDQAIREQARGIGATLAPPAESPVAAAPSSLHVAGDLILGSGAEDESIAILVDTSADGTLETWMEMSGGSNTGVGLQSLDNLDGTLLENWGNVALGRYTLQFLTDGNANTAVGDFALRALSTGKENIAIGEDAGFKLGYSPPADSTSSFSWNIFIGNRGEVEDENTIRIGRPFISSTKWGHERTFIAGDVAIGTETGPTNQLVVRDTINGNGGDSGNYVALIENASSGDSPDVLALKVGATAPGSGINFLGFFDGGDNLLGEIEGNGLGGVRFKGAELFLLPTDSPPACIGARKGMLYYDASVNQPCYCDGAEWRSVVADSLCT